MDGIPEEEMKFFDNLKERVQGWFFGIALKKVVKRLAQLGASYVAAQGLCEYGVCMDEKQATAAIYAGAEFARNFLKKTWPERFGWL